MDEQDRHLMLTIAFQGAMERVRNTSGLLELAIRDAVNLMPDALGDPPALPSVAGWLTEELQPAADRLNAAIKHANTVKKYLELL